MDIDYCLRCEADCVVCPAGDDEYHAICPACGMTGPLAGSAEAAAAEWAAIPRCAPLSQLRPFGHDGDGRITFRGKPYPHSRHSTQGLAADQATWLNECVAALFTGRKS